MHQSPGIVLATSSKYPDLTSDDRLLRDPLARLNIQALAAIWNDPKVEWERFRAVLLRSCWDYHLHIDEFLDWIGRLESLGVPLCNHPAVVRWNAHKTYLRVLQQKGISTIPTLWIERGSTVSLAELLEAANWRDAIVKPVVSASAYGMFRTSINRAAADQLAMNNLLKSGAVMVQPFLEQVCKDGEWSLMFFDRKYSHAVLKRPQPGDYRVQSELGGSIAAQDPPESFIADAVRVLAAVVGPLLYARVDGIEIENQLCLVELELIEPALFLGVADSAAPRFAEVISQFIG